MTYIPLFVSYKDLESVLPVANTIKEDFEAIQTTKTENGVFFHPRDDFEADILWVLFANDCESSWFDGKTESEHVLTTGCHNVIPIFYK